MQLYESCPHPPGGRGDGHGMPSIDYGLLRFRAEQTAIRDHNARIAVAAANLQDAIGQSIWQFTSEENWETVD